MGNRALGVGVVVIGIALVVIGLIYFTVAADKLPAFMGQVAHFTGHRVKRGTAAVVVGAIGLVWGVVAISRSRVPHYRYADQV